MKMEKKDPLHRSFGYAFQGIFTCVRKERNMKIHCVAAVLVVIAGVILKISAIEWCICMVLFGLVMALEHVNTAVEAVVDMVTEEYHERYRSRSSAHCGNYGSNRRVYYIFAEDSADIAVIQFRIRLP